MILKQLRSFKALSLALVASLLHLSLAVGLAAAAPQQILARVTSTGGVKVNGNVTPSGSTMVSGATVETAAAKASVVIGSLGMVELSPETVAKVEFNGSGVQLTLKKGCATLVTNKGVSGSVVNESGTTLNTTDLAEEGTSGSPDFRRLGTTKATSNGSTRRYLPVCNQPGAPSAPAAAGAGAAAGLSSGAIAGLIVAGVAGAIVIGIVATRGDDPSPSR